MIDQLENARHTNGYWASLLGGSAQEPRSLGAELAYEDEPKAVTAKDLQQLTITYLDMNKALRIQVKPDPSKN